MSICGKLFEFTFSFSKSPLCLLLTIFLRDDFLLNCKLKIEFQLLEPQATKMDYLFLCRIQCNRLLFRYSTRQLPCVFKIAPRTRFRSESKRNFFYSQTENNFWFWKSRRFSHLGISGSKWPRSFDIIFVLPFRCSGRSRCGRGTSQLLKRFALNSRSN